MLKEKQEKARLENITDSEQAIADLNRRHERDKQILLEENKKLNTEIESVSFNFDFFCVVIGGGFGFCVSLHVYCLFS